MKNKNEKLPLFLVSFPIAGPIVGPQIQPVHESKVGYVEQYLELRDRLDKVSSVDTLAEWGLVISQVRRALEELKLRGIVRDEFSLGNRSYLVDEDRLVDILKSIAA